MIGAKVDTSDLEAKFGRLNLQGLAADIAEAVAKEAVIPELAKYPGQRRARQPFRSAKSRRAFFAGLRRGSITVPYRRSGALGRNWSQSGSGGNLTLTSGQKYSDLVLTKGKQSGYHAGNWPTTEDIAQKVEGDTAELIGTAEAVKALQKAGLT